MPFLTSEKRIKNKHKAMLLIEPSIEEEQEAMNKSRPLRSKGRIRESDINFQHDFLNDNQTSVISNSTSFSSSSWSSSLKKCHKLDDKCRGKTTKELDRHKTKLTSLLIILFGLFLHLNIKLVHLQTTTPSFPLIRNKITTAKSLFNSTVPSLDSLRTSSKLPFEITNGGNNKTDQSNSSLTSFSEKIKTTPTSFARNQTTNITTNSTTSTTQPFSANSTHEDEETKNNVSDTNNSDDPLPGETEAGAADSDIVDDNKLSKLVLETAGEVSDKLIGRMRSSPSEEDDGEESAKSNDEDALINAEQPDVGKSEDESATTATAAAAATTRREDKTSADENTLTRRTADLLPITSDRNVDNNASSLSKNDTKLLEDEIGLKEAFETYNKWVAMSEDIIELFSKKIMPIIVENGYDVDAVTVTGILQVFNGIRGFKPWALKLLDSWTKLSPGILVGTQSDFGDFDECLNVRIDDPSGLSGAGGIIDDIDEETGLKRSTVVGKYCLADVEFAKPPRVRLASRNEELGTDFAPIELRRPLLNFSQSAAFKDTIFVETGNFFHMLYVDPLRVGICLTNKIDPDSFEKVFNKLANEFKVSIHFRGRCVTKYDKTIWTTYQKVSAYVIVIACCLVVLSTILDIIHMKLNKIPLPKKLNKWKLRTQEAAFKVRPLFTSFSIIRNTKRLFKPQQQVNLTSNFKPTTITSIENNSKIHNFTTTTTGDSSASSSECSPSIERRSSTTGSGVNLISAPSSLSISTQSNSYIDSIGNGNNIIIKNHLNNTNNKMNPLSGVQYKLDTSSSLEMNALQREQRQQQYNLLCLHGIRVITMTWMIVNHTYLFGGFFVLWAHRRLIDISEWPKSLSFQLVLNGWLTVETYFFLSATIIVLNVLPLMKLRKFSYIPYIFHRLVRLLPAYVGLVCLNFLWPLISSGPVWLVKGKSFIQTPCENYLWTNFLFVNNWIWPEKQCMVHTWFLSADFQLYLLAPIVVYLLCRRPVFGHSLNIIVAVVASIFSGFVIYAGKLMPTTLINKLEFDSIKQQLSYSYFATYQHMGPYCLGIFIGYLLHNRPRVKLPKHLTWCLWLLLPPLSFTTLLLTYLWNGAYDEPNMINPSPLVSAFYVAIHRTIWTSLVAWVVFACATGRAKLMSSFLSHSMFIPLSRLSFSIYLVHLPIIMFRALNLRHTIEWTDSNILWEACGNFIASIIVGYFVNVVFESPFINLEAVIFKRAKHHSHDQHSMRGQNDSQKELSSNNFKNNAYSNYNHHISHLSERSFSKEDFIKNKNITSLQANSSQQLIGNSLKTSGGGGGGGVARGSLVVEQSNSSDSDDNKSTTAHSSSDQHTIVSSPEQDRKLSSHSNDTNNTGSTLTDDSRRTNSVRTTKSNSNNNNNHNNLEILPKHMRWTGREDHQGSIKVKAFRPKQTSKAGEIFHSHSNINQQHQVELPAEQLNDYDSKLPLESLDLNEHQNQNLKSSSGSRLIKQIDQQIVDGKKVVPSVERARKYPFYDPPSLESSTTFDDSLYPITGEYQHYARAGFQQQLFQNQRPSQYATLARTSKFNHDLNKLQQDHNNQVTTSDQRLRPLYNISGNGREIYMGEPIQTRTLNQYNREASYLMKQRAHLFQRRQGRYNTLTGGAGSIRNWRKQYEGDSIHMNNEDIVGLASSNSPSANITSWQPPLWAELRHSNEIPTTSSGGNLWLKSGNMIPRVDSSTLRRQLNRPTEVKTGSIVEEETNYDEEDEDEEGRENENQENINIAM